MTAPSISSQVEFIISDGPRLGHDKQTRFIIRQRAAVLAATSRPLKRRSQKAPRRALRRQRSLDAEDAGDTSADQSLRKWRATRDLACLSRTGFNSAYELARMTYRVDLVDLSSLVNGNICGMSTEQIRNPPAWLSRTLDRSEWSYLQFIPSRYGHTDCLTRAVDCLMYRMYVTLIRIPTVSQLEEEIRLHSRALRSLQAALNDPDDYLNSDVLCASLLLSLYERLQRTPSTSCWRHHVDGISQLMQHRNASSFASEYDKALFIAHVEPTIYNSMLSGKKSHLVRPKWIKLHASLAEESEHLTARSALKMKNRMHLVKVAEMLLDFQQVVPSDEFMDDAVRAELERRAIELHTEVTESLDEYALMCAQAGDRVISSSEMTMRRDLLGDILVFTMNTKRFLVTLCSRNDKQRLECEMHDIAKFIVDNNRASRHDGLFTKHELAFATSTLAMENERFTCSNMLSREDQLLQARSNFMKWSEATVASLPTIAG